MDWGIVSNVRTDYKKRLTLARLSQRRSVTEDRRPLLMYFITSQLSSTFLRGQLARLQSAGFHVAVGTRCGPSDVKMNFDEGVEIFDVPFTREPSLLLDIRALLSTVRLIRQHRPVLVNASTPKAGLLGMVAARLCRVPVRVYQIRGFRFETASGWKRPVYRCVERITIHCSTHVIYQSESLRRLAERERLVVRPGEVLGAGGNGIDFERFRDLPSKATARRALGVDESDLVIGYVGRLTCDKGTDDLVEAFNRLEQHYPSLHLLLVGTLETDDPLKSTTVEQIRTNQKIVSAPWCENPGVAYRAMDILAFPSYREGLPNVPLEAQLLAVPVVGYRATGTIDAVQDGVTGLLVRTGDSRALVTALMSLLENARRRAEMGSTGARWVEAAFSLERVSTDLVSIYQKWVGIDLPCQRAGRHLDDGPSS